MYLKKTETLLFVLFILALCIFFYRLFWPTPALIVTPDFIKSDSWHIFISGKAALSEALKHNTLPLWVASLDSGFPLLAEGQIGTFFLPNLLLFKFFDLATAFNLSILCSLILISLGAYFWFRELKFSSLTCFYGGLTLAFSGMVIVRFDQLAVLQSLSLLPWVMWSTRRLVVKSTLLNICLLSILIAQQVCSGFPQTAVITLFFAAGYVLFNILSKSGNWISFLHFLCAGLLAVGLSGVQILPTQEYASLTPVEHGFNLTDATRYSFPFKHLLTFLSPFALGDPKNGTYPRLETNGESIFWENTGYIGLLPLVLIAIWFWRRKDLDPRHKKLSLFWLISLAGAFLFMLGKYSPIYFVFSFWPLNMFRVPARFIWIFVISAVGLSMMGLEILLLYPGKKQAIKLLIGLGIIFNTALLITSFWNYHLLGKASEWLAQPTTVSLLSHNSRIISLFTDQKYEDYFYKGWTDPTPFFFLRGSLAPNSGLIWHISGIGATGGRFLRRTTFLNDLFNRSLTNNSQDVELTDLSDKLLNLQGVTDVISPNALKSKSLTLTKTISDRDISLYIYKNKTAQPRISLHGAYRTATTLEQAESILTQADFLPDKDVLLEEDISLPAAQKSVGSAEIISDKGTSLTTRVKNNPQASLLVLTDTYYPGWKAYVDSRQTKIYPANIRQRAVVVPAGDHEIEFKFEPESFKTGLYISLGTFAVMSILGLVEVKRQLTGKSKQLVG